jgi:predicted transporter
MDIVTLIWQVGVLSVLLVFGIKIGLAMGFAGISKKIAAAIILGYALGIVALTTLASAYMTSVQGFFTQYTTAITIIMAAVIMYAGFHTINEWKKNQKNTAKATCLAMVAPCPCCFGAVIASIVIFSPMIGLSAATLGYYSAVALAVLITIFYLVSGLIVRVVKKPYPVLLGNFMLFAGLYFMASAIILPNINSVLTQKMTPLAVPDATTLFYVIIGIVVLVGLGIILNKKRSTLIEK